MPKGRVLQPVYQNNDVIAIDGALIFRFPKHVAGVDALKVEVAILRDIAPHVSLSVPAPVYTSGDTQIVGDVFAGYAHIPGMSLERTTLLSLDEGAQQALALQIGTFLRDLHGIPYETAIGLLLPLADTRNDWAALFARFREHLFPHMPSDAQVAITRGFEAFLAEPQFFTHTAVQRHSDFGPGNILYDPTTQRISGIIDFGSAALGDPAIVIAGILCSVGYGEAFLDRMRTTYPALAIMRPRARFYASTLALQEALFGVEHGDPEAFRRGIADYR
jgi:aminoglycoside 2''-phosphotransferase